MAVKDPGVGEITQGRMRNQRREPGASHEELHVNAQGGR